MQAVTWPSRINQVPKEVMVRRDVFEMELERIFRGPEWHPVAHEGEIPQNGDFKTVTIVGTPLLITRDRNGRIHVFYNSCTHRGTQLETAFRGNRARFECPYHRWNFSGDGTLESCHSRGEGYCPDFAKEKYGLRGPRIAVFKGLIFVTFSEHTPELADYLEEAASTLGAILCGDGRLTLIGYQKVRYQANWKGYNDSDGYHAPLLHGAFRVLNWQGGKGTQLVTKRRGHVGATSEISLPADGGRSLLKDPSLIEFKGGDPKNGSHVVKMFPLFVAVKHLDVINLRFATPLGVDQTEVHYAYFAHADDAPEMMRHRVRQASNFLGPSGFVSLEDAAVFQRIHVGSHTPGVAEFQKGVADPHALPALYRQNEESSNLPKWDYYREVMGFRREPRGSAS